MTKNEMWKIQACPIVGGNVRTFTLPEGFTEDPEVPKDCYAAKVSVSTDAEGFQHRAFLYLVRKEKLEAMRRESQALLVAVHNHNVMASDHKLLARRHRQGLR
jgi:hypothetical protein